MDLYLSIGTSAVFYQDHGLNHLDKVMIKSLNSGLDYATAKWILSPTIKAH